MYTLDSWPLFEVELFWFYLVDLIWRRQCFDDGLKLVWHYLLMVPWTTMYCLLNYLSHNLVDPGRLSWLVLLDTSQYTNHPTCFDRQASETEELNLACGSQTPPHPDHTWQWEVGLDVHLCLAIHRPCKMPPTLLFNESNKSNEQRTKDECHLTYVY